MPELGTEFLACHHMEHDAVIVIIFVYFKIFNDENAETELSTPLTNNVTMATPTTETAVMTSVSEKYLSVRSARHQARSIVASKRPLLSRSQAVIRDGSATIVSSMAMAIVKVV